MKVLLVVPTYPPNDVPCGIGDFASELAPRLAERGVSIAVAASTRYRGSAVEPIRVFRVTEQWNRRGVRALVDLACRERFDIVNLQYTPELYGRGPWIKLLPVWLALARGPRVVVTPHTLHGGYASAKWLAPAMLGAARRIIAPNREVASLIERRLSLVRSRVREIPIGSNIPVGTEPRERVRARVRGELGLSPDALVITHFGFAYRGKGIETLLEAARSLNDRGTRFTLVMIGGAWPGAEDYYAALQEETKAAGLGAIVRWRGHVSPATVDELLTASDVYVVAYDDGISARRGTLIAGLTHGLPIVSTEPVIPDSRFRDGAHALLVPRRDARSLADALARLAASPDLRARLGAGAEKLAPEFSWDAIAEATRAVYREVCA
jgi:glycosyltransferase involved in cell wall biosynthesis